MVFLLAGCVSCHTTISVKASIQREHIALTPNSGSITRLLTERVVFPTISEREFLDYSNESFVFKGRYPSDAANQQCLSTKGKQKLLMSSMK